MTFSRYFAATAAVAMVSLSGFSTPALAEEYFGTYVARLSPQDHHASDGYRLDSAAQIVRQDRANWHRFGSGDPEDEDDVWFVGVEARAQFERMLNRDNAMSNQTKEAITRGTPVVKVDVYSTRVRVTVLAY